MMSRSRLLTFLCATLLLSLVASGASAQQVSLSEGVAVPLPTIVDRDDALSLELNPAGLAHLEGVEMIGALADRKDGLQSGTGLMLAAELFGGMGVGYGLQLINPGLTEEAYRKHTFGLGVGGALSLGVNLNVFGSSDDRRIDELVSWDLGLQYRMLRWLAVGAVLRDANSPFLGDSALSPHVTLGAAARTLEGRLMLEADLSFYADSARVRPRFLAAVEPLDGLRLFGQILTDTGENGDQLDLAEFSVGLEMNLANVGLSGAGVSGDDLNGYSALFRFSSADWRPVFGGPQKFVTVKVGGDPPERTPTTLLGTPTGGSLLSLLQKIDAMTRDDEVQGMVLELRGVSMGYGQAWEVREALGRFREAGKPIVAYMHTPGQREFYLATIADHVWMGPMTTFTARGLSITQTFYRGAFDKLGVEPDFVRIAEYKSAPEAFTRESPSEPAEEALGAFLDDIWKTMLEEMAQGRSLKVEELRDLINTAPHDPGAAMSARLVDKVIYPDEIHDTLKELYGPSTALSQSWGSPKKDYAWGSAPAILVLHVDGNIVTGSGGTNPLLGDTLTGDRTVTSLAEWAGRNPQVKAVIVRVDSPGGSATASDLMYRSLSKLAEKKPVIISMGDVAASGGYYVAAAGQAIFCNPTTLTGSIGIYSGKFGLEKLLTRVGVSTFTTERGDNADLYDLYTAWDADQRQAIFDQIKYLYELFLKQVSTGRKMTRDEIDAVGRGHIWSGTRAREVGLCDHLGGLHDAIEYARKEAGLDADDMRLISLPNGGPQTALIPDLGLNADLPDTPGLTLGPAARLLAHLAPATALDPEAAHAFWAPLRQLIAPLRPAIDLGLTYQDGEPLALLPFRLEVH